VFYAYAHCDTQETAFAQYVDALAASAAEHLLTREIITSALVIGIPDADRIGIVGQHGEPARRPCVRHR